MKEGMLMFFEAVDRGAYDQFILGFMLGGLLMWAINWALREYELHRIVCAATWKARRQAEFDSIMRKNGM